MKNCFIISLILSLCISSFSCNGKKSESKKFLDEKVYVPEYSRMFSNGWKETDFMIETAYPSEGTVIDQDNRGLKVKFNYNGSEKTGWFPYEYLIYSPSILKYIAEDLAKRKEYAIEISSSIDTSLATLTQQDAAEYLIRYINAADKSALDVSSAHYQFLVNFLRYIIYSSEEPVNGKNSPYHVLAALGNADLVINYRIDNLTVTDENGNTPLMCAILAENYETVKAIYFEQKQFGFKNNDGKSESDLAEESKNPRIKSLLAPLKINVQELITENEPFLKNLQEKEKFKALHILGYPVPITIWHRAQKTGKQIYGEQYADFLIELSVAEHEKLLEENESEEEIKLTDTAFVYAEENFTPDTKMTLKLRAEPGITGTETGRLSYGTQVTILEVSENPDTVNDTKDFWYKVRADGKEGWCFGEFLIHPEFSTHVGYLLNDHEKEFWYTQETLKKRTKAIAIDSVQLTTFDGKAVSIGEFAEVEILACLTDSDDYYAYEDLSEREHHDSYNRWPLYIVNAKGCIGILSGEKLVAHNIHTYRSDYYYSAKTCKGEYFLDLYKYEPEKNKFRKFIFARPEGIAAYEEELCLGSGNRLSLLDIHSENSFNYTHEEFCDTDEGKTVTTEVQMFVLEGSIQSDNYDWETFFEIPITCNDYFAFHSIKAECTSSNYRNSFLETTLELDEVTGKPVFWKGEFTHYDNDYEDYDYFNCYESYYNWDSYEFYLTKVFESDRMPEK